MWFYGLSVAARVFQPYEAYSLQIMMAFLMFQKVEHPAIQKKKKERKETGKKKRERSFNSSFQTFRAMTK